MFHCLRRRPLSVSSVSGSVAVGTMHLAKGLEFRAVTVAACCDEVIPLQIRIERIGDDADPRVGLYLFIGGSSDGSRRFGPPRPSHCAHRGTGFLARALDFDRPWRQGLHSSSNRS